MNLLAKYIGIPYVHKGRTMQGLDCWGLIKLVYHDLGFEVRDLDDYEMEGHLSGKDYFSDREKMDWERTVVPIPYDVILLLNQKGIAFHAGLLTPDHKFIHCAKNTGVAMLNLTDVQNTLKVDGFYRLKARNDNNKI